MERLRAGTLAHCARIERASSDGPAGTHGTLDRTPNDGASDDGASDDGGAEHHGSG